LALTSPTGGGRSVGIVRSRTKATEFSLIGIWVKVKGKVVPLQAWSGPEASRKLRFPDFMRTAQNGGKVVSLTHRPPNTSGTHFC
jgi:hypothetical protein